MPIHDRAYLRMEDRAVRTGVPAFAAVSRYATKYLRKTKLYWVFGLASWLPALIWSVGIYAAGETGGVGPIQVSDLAELPFDQYRALIAKWVMVFLQFQAFALTFVAALSGGPTIAEDTRRHAFEMYFSRPISPWTYLAGKFFFVFNRLLFVVLFPTLWVLGMGFAFLPNCFAAGWPVAPAAAGAAILMSACYAIVVLGVSASVRSARYAVVFWFILNVFTFATAVVLVSIVTKETRFEVVSFRFTIEHLASWILGAELMAEPPIDANERSIALSASVLGLWLGGAGLLLWRRLRIKGRTSPDHPMDAFIETSQLARWYGPVVGITDVTVAIPGTIVGLLGPNGAGKSTLLKLITGQIRPSAGTVSVLGKDPMVDPSVFREVGYCSEDDALFEDLTTFEMVRCVARLHGMSGSGSGDKALAALQTCGVAALAARKCRELSKGQRQRVRLAAAIVHDPRILILDEPMTGLDPIGRKDVLDLIRTRARAGRCVVFSSHILHEVEAVARYVIVVNKGMVLAEGTLEHIREALSDYAFTLEITGRRLRPLAEKLIGREHVTAIEWVAEDVMKVSTRSARELTAELPPLVVELGAEVAQLATPDESLEALFGKLVARKP